MPKKWSPWPCVMLSAMHQLWPLLLLPERDRRYGPQSGAESQVFVRVIGCVSEPS
ncbi:MAG: hypothetical protein V7607_4116, partial [Solirubrobacteraceae bacterium]